MPRKYVLEFKIHIYNLQRRWQRSVAAQVKPKDVHPWCVRGLRLRSERAVSIYHADSEPIRLK